MRDFSWRRVVVIYSGGPVPEHHIQLGLFVAIEMSPPKVNKLELSWKSISTNNFVDLVVVEPSRKRPRARVVYDPLGFYSLRVDHLFDNYCVVVVI